MRLRKVTSAALAAAIFATSSGIVAFAEQDANMTKELTYVKERIRIPEEYTEFTHSTNKRYNSTSYHFEWSNKEGNKGVGVTISGKVITSYNSYDFETPNDWSSHFSKIPEKELLEKAKGYIKQLNPTIMDRTEIDEDSFKVILGGNNARLSFYRTANGIPVSGQTGSITINKDTGELIDYHYNWILGATFRDSEEAITVAEAENGFMREFPVKLTYDARYDWETSEYIPYLAYKQTLSGDIDAFTGNLSTFKDSYGSYDDDEVVEEDCESDEVNPGTGGIGGEEIKFTENEIKQLELENKLVTAEDSFKKLRAMKVFYIPQGADIRTENCFYDNNLKAYIRNVSLEGKAEGYIDIDGSVVMPLYDDFQKPAGAKSTTQSIYINYSINAETGELLNFNSNDMDSKKSLNEAETNEKAVDILKNLLGSKAGKFKVNGNISGSSAIVYDRYVDGKAVGPGRVRSISYGLNRVIYGIESEAENVSLRIGNSGYVTNYNLCYYGIKYPKPSNIITSEDAYKSFFKNVGLDLKYKLAYRTTDKKVVTALVYNASRNLFIDAFTGSVLSYNGLPEVTEPTISGYTDLENSKYKKYAEKLYSYRISIADENGKLRENDAITFEEYLSLLSSAGISTSVAYSQINAAVIDVEDDVIPVDGADSDNQKTNIRNKKLTRKEIAKYLVIGLYGDRVTSIKGIFKSPYKDVPDTSEYVGYIAVAKAAGLMKGTSSTKFKPNTYFKRGEALKLIYDYLSK